MAVLVILEHGLTPCVLTVAPVSTQCNPRTNCSLEGLPVCMVRCWFCHGPLAWKAGLPCSPRKFGPGGLLGLDSGGGGGVPGPASRPGAWRVYKAAGEGRRPPRVSPRFSYHPPPCAGLDSGFHSPRDGRGGRAVPQRHVYAPGSWRGRNGKEVTHSGAGPVRTSTMRPEGNR